MLPNLSGEFRLAADPELVFGKTGTAIARLRLVCASRKQVDGKWEDDKTLWINATAFKSVAENIADSLQKGDLVLVTGRLEPNEWTDKEGGEHKDVAIVVNTIGPSLAFNAAKPVQAERTEKAAAATGADPWQAPAQDDPPF
jgi:single-strand DNA-binding protein